MVMNGLTGIGQQTNFQFCTCNNVALTLCASNTWRKNTKFIRERYFIESAPEYLSTPER